MDFCKINGIKLNLIQDAFRRSGQISLCHTKSLEESFQPNFEETEMLFYYNDETGTTLAVKRTLE